MTVDLEPGRVYLHQTPMFHAASMGGILGIPAIGGTSVFLPLFEPARRHGAHRRLPGRLDGDGTDDDRHDARPSRVPTREVSRRCATSSTARLPCRRSSSNGSEATLPRCGALARLRDDGVLARCSRCSPTPTTVQEADCLGSAGRPVLGVTLSIQDRGGNALGPGEEGEVCAKAGNFMREYWNRPKETEKAFRGGWYHTGDEGSPRQGGLPLPGRPAHGHDRDRRRERLFDRGRERHLRSPGRFVEVAVIGIPDATWGEQVHAIVVVRPGASVTEEEIKEHARLSIARYKVPKSIEFRTEPLPLVGRDEAAEARASPALLGRERASVNLLDDTSAPARLPPLHRGELRPAPGPRTLRSWR